MNTTSYAELGIAQTVVLNEAEKAMENAYNPYSKFFVGAAIEVKISPSAYDVITGSNVENAAYGSTICAERAAILSANAKGHRVFERIAIIARGADFDTKEVSAPCGACRQMLFESSQIAEKDLEIILSTTKKDKIVVTTINELLPLAFGPKDLGIDVKKYQKVL